jgi:hypothetical protein
MLEHTPLHTSRQSAVYPRRLQRRHQRRHFRRTRRIATEPYGVLFNGETSPGSADLSRAVRADSRVPAAAASTLLGAATAMMAVGLSASLESVFQISGHLPGVVVAGALFALAIGVRVPQRFAIWLCAIAWRRFVSRGESSSLSGVLIGPGSADSSLQWVVLSVIALLSGVVAALMPVTLALASAVYDWMIAHFLWSSLPLLILQTLIVFFVGLVPFTALGLSISCAHHVTCQFRQWDTRATGWVVIGVGGGMVLSGELVQLTNRSDLMLMAAALPALVVSVVCAGSGSLHNKDTTSDSDPSPLPLPLWSDHWPSLLRASLVAVGCVGACAIPIWAYAASEAARSSFMPAAAMLTSAGAGALVGSRPKRSGLRSIGGFGVACAAAGMVTAAAALGLTHEAAGQGYAILPFACGSAAAIGFTLAYGHQTLLGRVASRSAVGATILGRLLVGSALMALVAIPWMQRTFAPPAALAALAMFLLAMGGVLIGHEPEYSPRTRRMRLLAVLGAIATVIVIAQRPASPWQSRDISRADTTPKHQAHGSGEPGINMLSFGETEDR